MRGFGLDGKFFRPKKAKEAEDAGEKKTKGPATKKTAEKKQQMPEGETTHTEETGPHDDVEKPEAAPADNSAEELKQALEEAEARAEEAEQRADEAEEARDEAEARAQETEQALEEEKKKEPAKETPEKSKNKRNTRKSTGTTSSTRKSK